MNRIYKIVWSKAKNAYVVTSELAKNHTKSASGKAVKAALAAAVGMGLLMGGYTASAADNTPGAGSGVAVGTGSNAPKAENVAVGKGATIKYSNGASAATGDVAVGSDAVIDNYASQGGSIAIGKNAKIENMTGTQESLFALGQTTYHSGNLWGTLQIPDNPENVAGSIAIGDNTYARTGSIMIGSHNYRGDIGDQSVDTSKTKDYGVNINATTLGTNSFNQGAFSTISGAYSIISGQYDGSVWTTLYAGQNFGATITGSLNSIESATASSRYSGVANSIVGTANRTFNSNGSLIFGAGNEITNSVTNINAPSSGGASAKDLADNLRSAVRNSESGGSTMAFGGGNKADYTLRTAIIGVNNTVKGLSGSPSAYNFITGFKNDVENVEHVSVIGSGNKIKGSLANPAAGTAADPVKSAIVIGDNRNLTGHADGTVVIGSHDPATDRSYNTTNADNMVLIGTNANVQHGGGVEQWSGGHVAIGNNSFIENYVNQGGSIAIGQNAHVQNMTGSTEATFIMDQYETKSATDTGGNTIQIATDVQKMSGGIAIGENTYARTGSLMVGTHKYIGDIGDTRVDTSDAAQMAKANQQMNATILGTNSFGNGAFSTVTGAYSIISGNYDEGRWRNFGAGITGSLNSIESQTATEEFAGVATNVLGTANRTFNTNGALVLGSGNEVTNSIAEIELPTKGTDYASSAKAAAEKLRGAIKAARGGGAVVTVGDANTVDYVQNSQIIGSNNTVIGSDPTAVAGGVSTLNSLVGSGRKLTNVSYSVIVGSAGSEMETTASRATILGHNANVIFDGGVALGAGSVADRRLGTAESVGYDPTGDDHHFDTTGVWKATETAVSVGKEAERTRAVAAGATTRQITNVAAGHKDTDAVNVAQLKKVAATAAAAKTNVTAGENVTVEHNAATNTYKISAKDTYTTGATYDAATKKLKFTQNDDTKNYEVDMSSLADGNDKLVSDNNALTLDGKKLSMSVKDTAGNEVKGSVDLEKLAAAIDTDTTYTMSGEENADNTTTITLKGSDGKESKVTVATKDTRNTVKAGENVTLDTAANTFGGTEYTVNVKADGKVENGSTKIVSGNTVYHETRVKNDGNYVKKENSAGDNLTILDKQVGKNTTNITNLGNTINNLDNRISKVGAGAAALAALHPLDFDPNDKWDIAAGFGNYRNASAAAVGLFYRPNERTMMSLGWTMGDNRNMINAGVSIKLGRGDVYTRYSKVEMANRIEAQNKEIEELKAKDMERDAQMKEILKQLETLRNGK